MRHAAENGFLVQPLKFGIPLMLTQYYVLSVRRDGQQRTSKLGYFDGPRSRDGAPELGLAGAPHRAVRGTRRIRSPSVARASPRSRSSSSKDTALDTEQQQKAKRVRLSIEDTEEQGSLNDQQPHATLR